MSNKRALLDLKSFASGLSLLYVEDNLGMLESSVAFYKKFFTNVRYATDGQKGWELFQSQHFDLVITDLEMPVLSGLEMLKKIKVHSPEIKVIIISAHNEVNYLHEAIHLGVDEFLVKPIVVDNLSQSINMVLKQRLYEKNRDILNSQLHQIFNYQHNLVMMFEKEEIVLANKNFLDFFEVDSLDEFKEEKIIFGEQLLAHHTFLCSDEKESWYDKARVNLGKLFHIKLRDRANEMHHLILKLQKVPDKKDYYILSMDDISELHLLKLFDKKTNTEDEIYKENNDLYKLLDVAIRNNIKVEVHNFYKGLSITHEGLILEADAEHTLIACNFLQLKAMQYERSVILVSELFPQDILYNSINRVDFENERASVSAGELSEINATHRTLVCVEPEEENQTVSLFQDGRKFGDDVKALSVSVKSAKIFTMYLLSGLKEGETIYIDMILNVNKKPYLIKTEAKIETIKELRKGFELSLSHINSDTKPNRVLINYVAQRQMFLIREFKKMQYSADGKIHKATSDYAV